MSSPGTDLQVPIPGSAPQVAGRFRVVLRITALLAVLYCFVVPLWISSVQVYLAGGMCGRGSTRDNVNFIGWELFGIAIVCCLYAWFHRNFERLGLHMSWKTLGVGIILWIAANLSADLVGFLSKTLYYVATRHKLVPWTVPLSAQGIGVWVFFAFLFINPWFEELMIRGYLLTELEDITGSTTFAVIASVVAEAGYHLYQGWANLLSLSVIFIAFSLYFAKAKKLMPVIIAHTAMDVFAGAYFIFGWHWLRL